LTPRPAGKTGATGADRAAVLEALSGGEARGLAQRARRNVRSALSDMDAERSNRRRGTMLGVLLGAGFLLVLSPAIWNTVDELLGGEFPLDLPGMIAALTFTLFAAVAAVLCWLGMQGGRRRLAEPRR
jgi:hypothetical protein